LATGLHSAGDPATIIATAGDSVVLASGRGGRAITDSDRALVLAGGTQLAWLDSNGVTPLTQTAQAVEGVVDSAGFNVAYVEAGSGTLH
jgi:hypothetical protein